MKALQDRRVLIAAAAGVLLLLAVFVLVLMTQRGRRRDPLAAERGALQVQMGETGTARLDPKAPLRCFVQGRFVGETSLAECAKRNGLEPGRMDVGVDASGQVAAAPPGDDTLTAPLPEAQSEAASAPATPARPLGAQCLRYAGGEWRDAGVGMPLRACAKVLFEGRCVRPGDALYGRSGSQTLRLVPGRVEASPNDRDFSTVMTADAEACTLDG